MTKTFEVRRNGLLMTKTLTETKAKRLVAQYRKQGFHSDYVQINGVESHQEQSYRSCLRGMAQLLVSHNKEAV